MDRQYTRRKDEPSNLRLCMEMRTMARERGLQLCEYYPRTEDMAIYVGLMRKEKIIVKKRMDEYAR